MSYHTQTWADIRRLLDSAEGLTAQRLVECTGRDTRHAFHVMHKFRLHHSEVPFIRAKRADVRHTHWFSSQELADAWLAGDTTVRVVRNREGVRVASGKKAVTLPLAVVRRVAAEMLRAAA